MSDLSDWESLHKQARRSFRKGQYDESIGLFKEALEINPHEVQLHDGLATAYFLADQYEDAVAHFTRTTELKPTDGKAYINLGAVYNRMEEFAKAAAVLRKGLRYVRKSSEGYYNLGIAHRKLNQMSMAVNAYKEAVRLNPQFAEAHQNLANVYLDMGSYKQAIQHYKQALKINPDFVRAQRGLKKGEQAAEEAKKAISPFGRLVDEKSYSHANTKQAMGRVLSNRERVEDRMILESLTTEMLELAARLRDNIRDELVPSVVKLNLTVTHAAGSAASSSVFEDHDEFQTAAKRYGALRKQLKAKMQELRSHEESFASS